MTSPNNLTAAIGCGTEIIKMKCDGGCEEHVGEVRHFNVVDPFTKKDWGIFRYCEEAVREDKSRGFIVTPIGAHFNETHGSKQQD